MEMSLNNNKIKRTYKEITLIPSGVSEISSRSEVNVLNKNNKLPLFAAPMSTVISLENWELFNDNKINTVIPRNIDFNKRFELSTLTFSAFSLSEFKILLDLDRFDISKVYYICIDIANGHMKSLHDSIKYCRNKYPNVVIMSGNVASPEGYVALSEAGSQLIRCGIGAGSGCITASNTGIFYPMASLIRDIYIESIKLDNPAKIIADGGIKNYDDIIKALALGADFVMMGGLFNKMYESAGTTYVEDNAMLITEDFVKDYNINHDNLRLINQYEFEYDNSKTYHKDFYGMSTKKAQVEMNKNDNNLKTSEGIGFLNKVEYTLPGWVDNFKHYLSSSMSYLNKKELIDFIGLEDKHFNILSNSAINSYNE